MIKDREEKYGGYLKVDQLTVKGKRGKDFKREVIRRPNAVAAIVFDTVKKKFIFVKQWRAGVAGDIIEVVAGLIDHAGEDTRQTMKREVEEEVGYEVDNIKMLDEFYSSPGMTTEMVTLYYCEVSNQVSEGGGVESEDEEIDIVYMTEQEVKMTQFKDAKTIIGVNWIKNK